MNYAIKTGVALAPGVVNYGPGCESGDYYTIFSPQSASAVSHIITVDEFPFVVEAFGLTTNESVEVWTVGGRGGGAWFDPLYLSGKKVMLTPTDNKLSLDVSGRYQFRFNDGSGVPPAQLPTSPTSQIFVVGHNSNIASSLVGLGKFTI